MQVPHHPKEQGTSKFLKIIVTKIFLKIHHTKTNPNQSSQNPFQSPHLSKRHQTKTFLKQKANQILQINKKKANLPKRWQKRVRVQHLMMHAEIYISVECYNSVLCSKKGSNDNNRSSKDRKNSSLSSLK